MDMEMNDIEMDDVPMTRVPSRTSRHAPNSKLKSKPKPQQNNSNKQTKPELELEKHKNDSIPTPPQKIEDEESKDSLVLVPEHDADLKMDAEPADVAEDAAAMEEEKEDCVVREIDVFFNPSVDPTTQLYILQYPLRPCWRPYELDERCGEVRLKPTSSELEIDLSIDVDSKNYDAGGDYKMMMAKQTLSSSIKPTHANGVAVGVLIGNKLHINPIRAVVQLRPSMEHLKPGGSKKKNISNKEDAIKLENLKDEKSPGPSRKQDKLPGRENEFDNERIEDWIPLGYHSTKSDLSTRYLEKIVVAESSPIQFSMSPYNYVSSICPRASNNNRSKVLPRGVLLSKPLEERFKALLREGSPAKRFDTLKHLAPNDSIEDVFNALQEVACLVQGLWVLKPKVLLNEGDEILAGVDPEILAGVSLEGLELFKIGLALARDYSLLMFHKNPTISYDQLNKGKPKLIKMVKGMLKTLAKDRPTLRDWKFKEAPDTTFVKLYPNIVEQQQQNWERAEKGIMEQILKSGKPSVAANPPPKPGVPIKTKTSKPSSKDAVRSSSGAASRTPMLNETREALPKALQKLFHTHKVCSFQQICQRLREMAVSEATRPKGTHKEAVAAANAVDGPQEELMEILNQVATNIHGVYVSKTSPDNPQHDPLRRIVIDLLIAEGPNGKLKKASILEAAKMQLNREIPQAEYQKVLNEFCVAQGGSWVLRRGDGNPK